MGLNIYAYIGAALLFAAGVWWVDNNGYSRALSDQAAAEKVQLKQDAKAVDKIKERQVVREKVIVKWKTKIKTVVDKGCYKLDKPLPVAHVNKLRDAFKQLEAKP